MKILNFGSCNIDYVYSLPHFVHPEETIAADARSVFLGGKGFNQSIAIAKSGVQVYHAGYIGKDGEAFREALKKHHVNIDFLKTVDAPTGHAIIQVDQNGENCIMIYSGANSCVTEDFVNHVLSCFDPGDILLLQNEINNLAYIVSAAYQKGMKIILNPSPINDALQTLDLNQLYAIVLNETEGYALTGKRTPKDMMEHFGQSYRHLKVVLTRGSKGCIYYDCATLREYTCPAFVVTVKDTTSAGDTFMGYYISGLVQGMCTEKNLRFAAAASALTVSRNGSSDSIPEISEVLKAISTLKPYRAQNDKYRKEQIMIYMNDHLATANLTELSQILNYSLSSVSERVRCFTGFSFTALLQKARNERAGELLRETELPIEEIIKLVGYENGSFFRKVFHKEFGKSPLAYRKFYKGRMKDDG